MTQHLDRVVDDSKSRFIAGYEGRIDQLEKNKLIVAELFAKAGQPRASFEQVFELAFNFLASPWKL